MKNLKIGKDIKQLLLNNASVVKAIGDKVFPLVANEGTTFPFVVYRRSGYRPYSNKDYSDEVASVEMAILSDKYIDSVDVADKVANALEHKSTEDIDDIEIENATEEFNTDIYIQKLNLRITINN